MLRRRDVLKGAAGAALIAALPNALGCSSGEEATIEVPEEDGVFAHGVASGDPLPDGVILWTRVNAKAPVDVAWEMAKDAAFAAVVRQGTFATTAERDYTVKVDVTGLEPGTTYYYRFRALGATSSTARTRTAPRDAKRLRFAVVSCSSLPHGFFHVYRAIAERADLDAVIHLGDYIYEYGDNEYGSFRTSEPRHEIVSLDDYRTRHSQYKRDPDLQEVHRQHPFVCTWDDHEFADNAWKGGAENHDPAKEGAWEDRKRAAMRAYFEWMPVREQPEEPTRKIWRSLGYGNLAELVILDTRIWARDQQGKDLQDPVLQTDARQLLGADQEAWLAERLHTSTAKWKLVCQQVMMTTVPAPASVTDSWDGYPKVRQRFFDILEKTKVNDVVVLTGDVHSSWACDLARTPADPLTYDRATGKGALAVELMGPAISSPGPDQEVYPTVAELVATGWIKFVDLDRRGFILLDLDERRAHAAFLHVPSISRPGRQELHFTAGFATYAGENRLRREDVAPERPTDAPPLAPAPVLVPNSTARSA
jgi:alkaline phosphatase D